MYYLCLIDILRNAGSETKYKIRSVGLGYLWQPSGRTGQDFFFIQGRISYDQPNLAVIWFREAMDQSYKDIKQDVQSAHLDAIAK